MSLYHSIQKRIAKTLDALTRRKEVVGATYPIDFVITWVDCDDPEWLADYASLAKGVSLDRARYRDMSLLRYWFRAVEKYAPWVHKIYFITNGQLPEWLNVDHPKLVHIKHEDYIPAEYLPTFSSRTIELCIPLIESLSEHFVYFNDDMFLNGPVEPNYYFCNGLPIDHPQETIELGAYSERDHFSVSLAQFASTMLINHHFSRREVVRNNRLKWLPSSLKLMREQRLFRKSKQFPIIMLRHVEQPFLKSVWKEVWNELSREVDFTCKQRQRQRGTMNPHAIRCWQLATNKWHRRYYNPEYSIVPSLDNLEFLFGLLRNEELKSVCINDSPLINSEHFEPICARIKEVMHSKHPTPSEFEKAV